MTMIFLGSLLASSLLGAHSASAIPVEIARRDVSAAIKAITTAAPETASCSGAPVAGECATAAQAAPAIINGFAQYKITTPGEWAALLSIMIFESGNFKYNNNHFPAPGTPGKGTRNMQSPEFNQKYATYLNSIGKISSSDLQAAGTDPTKILNLLEPDQFSFASAAWFLDTQCTPDIRTGLQAGTEDGYNAYLTTCIGTTSTPDRITGWQAAMKVVG